MRSHGKALTSVVLTTLLLLVSQPGWSQSVNGTPLPTRGVDVAVVEILEVSDFQCPYCAKAQGALKQVMRTYQRQVRQLFLHQPLPFHDQALAASLASVLAQKEGKFWELADTFFIEQQDLSTNHIRAVALRNGLAVEALNEGLKSPEARSFVEANQRVAEAVGAKGTPTFFVNGTRIRGAKPFESFKKIVDIEIAMAGKEPMTPEQAAAYRQRRVQSNNPALHAYLYGGKPAPAKDSVETKPKEGPTPSADDEQLYKVTIRPTDAVYGEPDKALVTMVSFMGYQCAYSRELMTVFEDLLKHYGESLALVVKHLPLSIHPQGQDAAATALCAHEQGKFWELNRRLTADNRLSARAVQRKARAVGLDMNALKACMDKGEVRNIIREDGSLAQTVGARGTPTTYINGRQIVGSVPMEELASVIEAELARVKIKVAEGMAPKDIYPSLMKSALVLDPLDATVLPLDLARSPTRGSQKAPVQLVVFADYQCPYCAKIEPSLQQLYQRYAGQVAVTVKHFPLSFHKRARPAAYAAYCAKDQDAFWPMHDALVTQYENLSDEVILELAKSQGLILEDFKQCLSDPQTVQEIEEDMKEGRRIGLQGTPTLLFNGRRYDLSFGGTSDDLAQTVDRLLSASAPSP